MAYLPLTPNFCRKESISEIPHSLSQERQAQEADFDLFYSPPEDFYGPPWTPEGTLGHIKMVTT